METNAEADAAASQYADRKENNRVFVLHSGGIDSSVCLGLAINQFIDHEVISITMLYGQRHDKEAQAAGVVARALGVQHIVFPMPNVLPQTSMLTDSSQEIPDASYEELPDGISPTYVPYRNGTLLSILAAYAQANNGCAIYFGAHSEDAANWAYPDCTPEFIGAMANAIFIGTYQQVRLHTPLMWMKKAEIIKVGVHLAVPLSDTWSCYAGEEFHCGTCPTCRARKNGFRDAGISDYTVYVEDAAAMERADDDERRKR